MYNSISASFILHLHCASSVSHCIHSFKQQSQWLILRSICYCMAEGSCAEHTCPATCLHHRARAGRDSVCQCLQWSDYVPVLKHVQCHSVRSLSSAAVYIPWPGGGCGNGTNDFFWGAPHRYKCHLQLACKHLPQMHL